MERWSVEHRAFVAETIFKNNDSVVTQRIFRRHFNIHWNELNYFLLIGSDDDDDDNDDDDDDNDDDDNNNNNNDNNTTNAANYGVEATLAPLSNPVVKYSRGWKSIHVC
jgi:hypothetical protein